MEKKPTPPLRFAPVAPFTQFTTVLEPSRMQGSGVVLVRRCRS